MNARRFVAPLVGIAVGLLVAFAALWFFSRRDSAPPAKAEPAALAGAPLPEDDGALDVVLVHYVPRLERLLDCPYREFLGTLDRSTKLVVIVPAHIDGSVDAEATASLHRFLAKIDPTGALDARATVVPSRGPLSVWSKDRALIMAPPNVGDGRTGLLIPEPPDPRWIERSNDWRTLASVAAQMPDCYYVRELPLVFDAGDFAVTGGQVIVDVNIYTRNVPQGVRSPPAMKELLGKLLARPVVMLGDKDGDVPRHHMSMYMTPVGGGTVLVGDPAAGEAIVGADYAPGDDSIESHSPLKPDFSDVEVGRYERAAKDLAAAGFHVVRIPTIAYDDRTYFAYTNGVYEVRGGKKIAWVPAFAKDESDARVLALDAAARAVYEGLGWEVRPVHVRAVYTYHGTIGCLANVLARTLVKG